MGDIETPMNKLSSETRARVLHLLCEGSSMRAVSRLTGVAKVTVEKLLRDAGRACADYQNRAFRDLTCKRVQVDEIWAFVYAKQANVRKAKAAPEEAGDAWTWTAIDAETKLIFSWMVGGRDANYATAFMHDVQSRLANRVQLTSDGHWAYLNAVEDTFGHGIDFAQLVKRYGPAPDGPRRYSPPVCLGATPQIITGSPDPKHISTSYAERSNLTMRMHMRRFTRLTNGFSKKLENHAHQVALHMMYYNFVRLHQRLRITPAMAASVTDTLWDMDMIVKVIEAYETKPAKRGPYKKRLAA
jgi:IS1 family transposase